jgi:hypothetical protein
MRLIIMVGAVGFLAALTPALLADEKRPTQKVPADWLYPGAKDVASGGSSTNGVTVGFVVQEKSDDVATILKHYGDKLGIELAEMSENAGGKTDVAAGIALEYCHVGLAAGRTATVSTFVTKAAVTNLTVSRSPGGKVSTVTITHVPHNAGK